MLPSGPALSPDHRKVLSVYAAFIGFGLASWVMANGLFIELAALYRRTPEEAHIGAYLILFLQASNVLPVLYMVFNGRNERVSLHLCIALLLALGLVVSVLLALLWRETSVVFGAEHSTALLLLVFCCGLVSSTTSVVFYPFVAQFPRVYTSALATGEGLSGTLMGIVGLLQNSGGELRFTVSTFFLTMGAVVLVSAGCFAFLLWHPFARQARAEGRAVESRAQTAAYTALDAGSVNLAPHGVPPSPSSLLEDGGGGAEAPPLHFADVARLLALQAVVSALAFGLVPSIIPIACTAYRGSSLVLMWSSVLSMSCDPLSRFVTSWHRNYNVPVQTGAVVAAAALITVLTAQAPHPWLSDARWGGALPVAANCAFTLCYAYANTMVYLSLKRDVEPHNHERAYQWSGFSTQVGASIGTIVAFGLVEGGVL